MPSKDNFVQTISRRVTLEELPEYIGTPARVSEDILDSNGATLVPRGANLSSLGATAEEMKQNLRRWNVLSIAITIQNTLDLEELEEILRTARDSVPSINPQLAQETIHQVKNVYKLISEGACRAEDIENLATQGRHLAQEVAQAPQLMLCLGRVRSWDEYTYVHSLNVSLLSGFLASRIFPGKPELAENVTVGGILHDLGKALVPKQVLNKPGRLTDEEFSVMKKHTIFGDELAKSNGVTDVSALAVIRGHHERCSGDGYPDALNKSGIRMEARIAAVADVFDALTAKRVYKEPMDSRAAVSLMLESMNSHFDQSVVRALLVSIGLFPPGTGVELSDGSLGVVVASNGKDLMRPEVLLQIDNMGRKAEKNKLIDLSKSDSLYVKRPINDAGKSPY